MRTVNHRNSARATTLLLCLTLTLMLNIDISGRFVLAQEATPTAASAVGLSRANPTPLGKTVQAGPLVLRVEEVLTGQDAVAAILAASPHNAEPRDGATYVAVNLSARNTGDQPLWLDNDDFAVTGASGLIHRFLGVQPPEPALDVTLAPGDAAAGWLAFGVPVDESSLLLLFDSPELGGTWADRLLALQDGARIPDLPQRAATVNTAGADPTTPLAINETAVTDQWSVTLLEVVSGAPAFDLVDYRSGALGPGDAAGEDGSIWVALHFQIQNAQSGGTEAYFPANAFTLADDAGNPVLDIATLTPPWPDATGGYYPGASRDGWVMFDVPLDYTTSTVRFLPYATSTPSPDPRYFSFG
jgi:hypothetical protein